LNFWAKTGESREGEVKERTGLVTFQGTPLTLVGDGLNVGDKAPEFSLLNNDLGEVNRSSFNGKVCLLVIVPSLDTPVCDAETRRFNEEAAKLGPDVVVLAISMDLPFAQKRWCGAAGIEQVQTLSDHRDASFGKAYGLLIKELRLLARAVLVVDQQGIIRYEQLVSEIASEPDYEAALGAVKELVQG
jgi:thiol peroxidase